MTAKEPSTTSALCTPLMLNVQRTVNKDRDVFQPQIRRRRELAISRASFDCTCSRRSVQREAAHAIAEGKTDQLRTEFDQLLEHPDLPARARVLISTLQAILDGSRDPVPADNPDVYFTDAVEVRLLLYTLPPRGLRSSAWRPPQ